MVDETGKENVIMGVKEFFGKSIRSTDDDMDADQRLAEELEIRRKMEDGRKLHEAKMEKVKLPDPSQSSIISTIDQKMESNPSSKQSKSILKTKENKEQREVIDEIQQSGERKAVKFESDVKPAETKTQQKRAKKAKEEKEQEEEPARMSLFKQRMLGLE